MVSTTPATRRSVRPAPSPSSAISFRRSARVSMSAAAARLALPIAWRKSPSGLARKEVTCFTSAMTGAIWSTSAAMAASSAGSRSYLRTAASFTGPLSPEPGRTSSTLPPITPSLARRITASPSIMFRYFSSSLTSTFTRRSGVTEMSSTEPTLNPTSFTAMPLFMPSAVPAKKLTLMVRVNTPCCQASAPIAPASASTATTRKIREATAMSRSPARISETILVGSAIMSRSSGRRRARAPACRAAGGRRRCRKARARGTPRSMRRRAPFPRA